MKRFALASAGWLLLFFVAGLTLFGCTFEQALAVAGVTYIIPFGGLWCAAIVAWS